MDNCCSTVGIPFQVTFNQLSQATLDKLFESIFYQLLSTLLDILTFGRKVHRYLIGRGSGQEVFVPGQGVCSNIKTLSIFHFSIRSSILKYSLSFFVFFSRLPQKGLRRPPTWASSKSKIFIFRIEGEQPHQDFLFLYRFLTTMPQSNTTAGHLPATHRRVIFRPVGPKAIEKHKILVWLLAFKPNINIEFFAHAGIGSLRKWKMDIWNETLKMKDWNVHLLKSEDARLKHYFPHAKACPTGLPCVATLKSYFWSRAFSI